MVADGLVSLSCESGQVWFVTGAPNVTPRRAELSHADRPALPEALGVLSPADGGGLGAAGYIRRAKETETAEVAVTVLDKWQRRRLGTELASRLPGRARRKGICRFTALVDDSPPTGLTLIDP